MYSNSPAGKAAEGIESHLGDEFCPTIFLKNPTKRPTTTHLRSSRLALNQFFDGAKQCRSFLQQTSSQSIFM